MLTHSHEITTVKCTYIPNAILCKTICEKLHPQSPLYPTLRAAKVVNKTNTDEGAGESTERKLILSSL